MPKYYPDATNEKTTEETFFLRSLYKATAYPEWGPQSIDFWYDKWLYGRIDREENIVLPKAKHVKQIGTDRGLYFALDFVCDAFGGLRNAIQKGMARNTVAAYGSIYSGVRVRRATDSANKMYLNYLQLVDDLFTQEFLKKDGLQEGVENFEDYFRLYVRSLQERASLFPITKSAFVTSKYATPYMSGLIIEISAENHGSDLPKAEVYINDPNFNVFRNTAQQYGFMIDKNAPWRLTADLASPFMQRFGEKYGVLPDAGSASNIFDTHYDMVYTEDIKMLKRFFFASYQTFSELNPVIRRKALTECSTLTIEEKDRLPYGRDRYEATYSDSFWVRLYMMFRLAEEEISLTEQRRTVILKKVLQLLPHFGLETTVKAANHTITNMNPNRWQNALDREEERLARDLY